MDTLSVARDRARPGLLTVTLNRPQKLNANNAVMHADLRRVLIGHGW